MQEWLTFEEIQEIILNSTFQSLGSDLKKFLERSRKIQSNRELFELQVEISHKIIPLEKRISGLRSKADRKKRNIEWLSREVFKAQRRALKQIIDGIAWRYLNFKRSALRLLAEHHQTGFLDKGFLEEIKVAQQIIERTDYFVIINDLTEILRHGDLTIISKDKIFIDEVKGGTAHDRRKIRQKNRVDDILDMLNKKVVTIGRQKADVAEIPIAPTSLLSDAEMIINKTYGNETGIYADKITPYLWVRCANYEKMAEYFKKYKKMPDLPKNPFRNSLYFRPESNFTVFESTGPNLAPYTIFPFKEEVLVDLILGRTFLYITIGEDEIVESVKGKGWTMEIPSPALIREMINKNTPKESKDAIRDPKYFVRFMKDNFVHAFPREVLLRVPHEFLSVKSLVDLCEYSLKNAKPYERLLVTDFTQEYIQWL